MIFEIFSFTKMYIVVMLLLLAHVVEGNATRVDATTIYTIDAHKRTRSQEIEFELKKS